MRCVVDVGMDTWRHLWDGILLAYDDVSGKKIGRRSKGN